MSSASFSIIYSGTRFCNFLIPTKEGAPVTKKCLLCLREAWRKHLICPPDWSRNRHKLRSFFSSYKIEH